jgi:hypothetical protein
VAREQDQLLLVVRAMGEVLTLVGVVDLDRNHKKLQEEERHSHG